MAKKSDDKFQWVGVRFINPSVHHDNGGIGIVYHYKVKKAVKLHLGQELVVRNQYGTTVVVVVQLGTLPNVGDPNGGNWKWITDKVAPL